MPPQPAAERERPRVPNHELMRVIGRGAYGEIWMARSLTGALRAIKIVDERTFENDKAFQREFEGMARFEPISRSDSGFVDILHVGREEGGHFFYYVMELADDVTGERVDPADYVPKTLRTELGRRCRLLVDECLALGLSLTRALAVLHRHGLVHRDIKPANIIFVGGVPKIADIGLVAASGQESFVGTEGYVPPEGPGSVQADIFSLGKVLYEIAMGKDRLDFPALHSDLTSLPEKDRLLRLNALLLRACAPHPRDRYVSAEEMCEDLERIHEGKQLAHQRRMRTPVYGAAAALALAGGGVWWHQHQEPAALTITADPPEAMVVLDGEMKHSPAQFDRVKPGLHTAHVMSGGFDAAEVRVNVIAGQRVTPPRVTLARSHGVLRLTSAPAGAEYTLLQSAKVMGQGKCPAELASLPTGEYDVRFNLGERVQLQHLEVKREEPAVAAAEFGSGKIHITSDPAGAEIMADGYVAGQAPLDLDLPEGRHEFIASYRTWPEQRASVDAVRDAPAAADFRFLRGSLKITSAPTGATVLANKVEIGKAPLLLEDLEPGSINYDLRLSGYRTLHVTAEIKPGEQSFLGERLVQRAAPQPGHPWENTLNMRFAPVDGILVGIWPVRVRDFDAFCQATARTPTPPDFQQDPSHPVVRVNWDDATAFCEWLTQKELHAGQLETGQLYRLPTDAEWSQAVGLPPESGSTPEERDGKLHEFPWGQKWPPPAAVGNYADSSLKQRGFPKISGYRDGYAQTSPVGSFAANRYGLYDMGGNVWQWVQDSYKGGSAGGKDWGVLRGGSWATSAQAELRSSYRNVIDRTERDVIFGFRVVLAP